MAIGPLADLARKTSSDRTLDPGERRAYFYEKTRKISMSKPGLIGGMIGPKPEPVVLKLDRSVTLDRFNVPGTDVTTRQQFVITVDCSAELPDDRIAIGKFARELGVGAGVDRLFMDRMRDFIRKDLEKSREKVANFSAHREKLERACTEWVRNTFGLEATILLGGGAKSLNLKLDMHPISTRACDSDKDLRPKLTVAVRGRVGAADGATVNRPLTKDDLQQMMEDLVGDFVRRAVTLQEYYFGRKDGDWREELRAEIEQRLDGIGWRVVDYRLDVDREMLGYDDAQVEETHPELYSPPNYGKPVRVMSTAQLAVENAAKYEASGRPKAGGWLAEAAGRAVQTVLFEKTYTELLVGWPSHEKAIREAIEEEAKRDGWRAGTIITRPELPAIDLLTGSVIKIPLSKEDFASGREYETKYDGEKITFSLEVSLRISDLGQIREVLDQKKDDIEAHIRQQITDVAVRFARSRTAQNFYLEFDHAAEGADTNGAPLPGPFRDELSQSIQQLLREKFHADSVDVDVVQRKDDVVKTFTALRNHPSVVVPITFTPLMKGTPHEHDMLKGAAIDFDCELSVSGVDPEKWAVFQSYDWEAARSSLIKRRRSAIALFFQECKEIDSVFGPRQTGDDGMSKRETSGSTTQENEIQRINARRQAVKGARRKLQIVGVDERLMDSFEEQGERPRDGANSLYGLDEPSNAEVVAFYLGDRLRARLDTLDADDVTYSTEDRKRAFLQLVQNQATAAARDEFGLAVTVVSVDRELTQLERTVSEQAGKAMQIRQLEADHLLDTRIRELQRARSNAELEDHAQRRRAEILLDRRNTELNKDILPDDPDLQALDKALEETIAGSGASDGRHESVEKRKARLLAKIEELEERLDELPPPREGQTDEERDELEQDVRYRREQYDEIVKGQSSATPQSLGVELPKREMLPKPGGDGGESA